MITCNFFKRLSNASFEDLEKAELNIEKVLNITGYIPMVSILSGGVRKVYATAQVIIGFSCSIGFGIGYLIGGDERLKDAAYRFGDQAMNGYGNFGRAVVEEIPVIGNIVTIIYDRYIRYRQAYSSENPTIRRDSIPPFRFLMRRTAQGDLGIAEMHA